MSEIYPINEKYPLISIVMATYNGERFLYEQLDSLLKQSYSNIEIIIIDDKSSDNTFSILQQYAKENSCIKLFQNAQNIGYVKNFEKGMLLASGDFIAPCDQDDIWDKDKIAILFNEIKGYAIAYCNSQLIDEQGNKLNKNLSDIKRLIDFDDCRMFAIGNSAPGHAMLIRKDVILQSIPFAPMVTHDYWISFVATFKSSLKFIDIPLVSYRKHSNNVSCPAKSMKLERNAEKEIVKNRLALMYAKCPTGLIEEKAVLLQILKSYQSSSLINNFKRMVVFFQHRDLILAYKRRSSLRKVLFSFKMFFTIK